MRTLDQMRSAERRRQRAERMQQLRRVLIISMLIVSAGVIGRVSAPSAPAIASHAKPICFAHVPGVPEPWHPVPCGYHQPGENGYFEAIPVSASDLND